MPNRPAKLLEWDFARVSESMDMNHRQVHGSDWGIKGHNRPWVLASGGWQPGMQVLDVGAGYSDLPYQLVQEHRVNAWVADDFGLESDEPLWQRWGDPKELASKFPGVQYVFKRLGKPVDELPEGYFDRVYSASVLEHVSADQIDDVLDHMYRLLRPGGLMLHTVDLPFPRTLSGSGAAATLAFLIRLSGRNLLARLGMFQYRRHLQSVEGWSRLIGRVFDLTTRVPRRTTWQMVLDQDVLVEPPEVEYSFYPPNDQPKPYWKVASLKMILQKPAEGA